MSASTPAKDNAKARKARACPICGRPGDEKYDPFCSRRCADVDLYRWLNGNYAIPGSDEPGEERREVSDKDEED
jgi:endogenous inhibitor of DNA gyrase (YacG/DUF329 family)